jgi:hypothetical protein
LLLVGTVDCWIGVIHEADKCLVRVAGTLTRAQVPELVKACSGCGKLVLDLQDLVNADAAGVDAIRTFRTSGATLVGTSGYIQIKIDSPVHGSRPA